VLSMISGIESSKKFSLLDLQAIHGSLCYLCFVFSEGASRLAVFSNAMVAFKGNTFAERWLSRSVLSEETSLLLSLHWWQVKLEDTTMYRQLRPGIWANSPTFLFEKSGYHTSNRSIGKCSTRRRHLGTHCPSGRWQGWRFG
jgi:hypothetical protein